MEDGDRLLRMLTTSSPNLHWHPAARRLLVEVTGQGRVSVGYLRNSESFRVMKFKLNSTPDCNLEQTIRYLAQIGRYY